MKLHFAMALTTVALVQGTPDDIEGNLRGTQVDVYEDRDLLLTAGYSSNSLSFSWASPSKSSDWCYDYKSKCLEVGDGFTSAYTDTYASGNAFAIAWSEECLWLVASCDSYAEAYAQACAFTKVQGHVVVNTTVVNSKKKIDLTTNVKAASTTFAMAQSVAVADAYANVTAYSYTNVLAFCDKVKNKSIYCAGAAKTELSQIAVASAQSFGTSLAVSGAGATAGAGAAVSAEGSVVDYVSGIVTAYAKSWAFAAAGAAASAFAGAFTEVSNKSWAGTCVGKHGEICGKPENSGKGICNYDPDAACALAKAKGQVFAGALADACASAFVKAYADAEIGILVSANVDCKSTPKLTWTCTNAHADAHCYA